jgi:hypothetical protein
VCHHWPVSKLRARWEESMTSSGIIRWGAIAAMIGGALWVVWGLLGRAIPYAASDPSYGGLLRLSAGLVLLAALLTLGGLLGLDALEAASYWNLGRAGFYIAGVGLLAQALAALVLLLGSEALQWLLTPVGSLAVVVGLALYGAATLRAGVLARWCGWALVVVPAVASFLNSKVFYGSIALFGVLWVALGYVLWSRRGAPSRQRVR